MAEPIPILLIDDDAKLARLLREYLGGQGFGLAHAADGKLGLAMLKAKAYQLVLLDVMLPEMDGIEVCRRARESGFSLPILMLTARGEEADRVMGLELGADDYLPKPFGPRELLARIRALLRRASGQVGEKGGTLRRGPLSLNPETREVKLRGKEIHLTSYEFELLRLLMLDAGRVLSRDQILDRLKGEEFESFDRSIDVHVSKLRQKLEDNPKEPRLIKTVRGVGYQLAASE
jgi:DNA-binding response OmpR family regulator